MAQPRSLRALYYPFSRTKNISSVKQFLLLYDEITFLDPVTDEEWRAHLFSNLAKDYNDFEDYSDLAESFPTLISEGAVKIIDPETVTSRNSDLTAASVISDLADPNWLRLCDPNKSGISHEINRNTGMPFWRTFKAKIPDRLLEIPFDGDFIEKHFLYSGGERYAWHLSYAAGSAIALNVHMAAAEELGLQLVSDSPLHNRLLLAKAQRDSNSSFVDIEDHGQVDRIANGAMITVIDKLMPPEALSLVSVDEILRFRQETSNLRAAFSEEIRKLVRNHDLLYKSDQASIPFDLAHQLSTDVRTYGNELASVRDTIWPRLLESVSAAAPVSTSGAGYVASYISGSGYLLAASLLLHALRPIKTLMEIPADLKKVKRSPSSAVAFLVKSQQLLKR